MTAEGFALLKEYESFVGHAYADPASELGKALQARGLWRQHLASLTFKIPAELQGLSGAPWTIGYGFTDGVLQGDRMSRDDADQKLAYDVESYESRVMEACTLAPNENELSAMVCLAWNIGVSGFKKSSVLKAHNRGDKQAAARAFSLWNKAGGAVMAGLTRRRAAEAALYLKPASEFGRVTAEPLPMPQQVQPEGSLLKSPMMLTSGTAGGVATVSLVAEGARGVRDIKDSLGDMLPWIVAGLAIAACAFLMIQRYRQRRGGWA